MEAVFLCMKQFPSPISQPYGEISFANIKSFLSRPLVQTACSSPVLCNSFRDTEVKLITVNKVGLTERLEILRTSFLSTFLGQPDFKRVLISTCGFGTSGGIYGFGLEQASQQQLEEVVGTEKTEL